MKTLKWFRVGEPIPDGSKFIKIETRRENVREHHVHDLLDPDVSWDDVDYALYEVSL